MCTYKIGLVSISFRGHAPEEIVKMAKHAGLTCIEWGSDVHAPCKDRNRLSEIAALQKKYGIECASYGTYFRLGETPLDELSDYIVAAKTLGTRILRLWGGTKKGADMTEAEFAALIDTCRTAAAIAEAQNVILCLECHKRTVTETPDDGIALMEAVNSPHFRMYWQPFQWLDAEENLRIAKVYAPYSEHLHVFNWHENERLPLAQATTDWKGYLTAFSAPRTLLLEFMPDDRLESLPTETAALNAIIGE